MQTEAKTVTFLPQSRPGAWRVDVEALYRDEYKALVRRLRRMLRSQEDAEEVAQMAFIKLLEGGAKLDELKCGRAYLLRIGRNLAIDHLRHGKVGQRIFTSTGLEPDEQGIDIRQVSEDAEATYIARDILGRVDTALTKLPAKCRTTFLLSKTEDKTYPEIAKVMGLSVSMIEKYMSVALTHVRTHVPCEALAVS